MTRRIRRTILGRKLGMSQVYDKNNVITPVTVIEAGPCTVLQIKTANGEGYDALQVGFDDRRKEPKQPQQGLYKKVGTSPKKWVREIPPFPDKELKVGDLVDLSFFEGVASVDVGGTTKGRGFTGVVRRWNKKIGPKSHGSKSKRVMGSIGMHQDPGRVPKGRKFPGQYGNEQVKSRNLDVVSIDKEKHLLLVKGAVPGPVGGYVYIQESLPAL